MYYTSWMIILSNLSYIGSQYLCWYYRFLGCNIGNNVCLYPNGGMYVWNVYICVCMYECNIFPYIFHFFILQLFFFISMYIHYFLLSFLLSSSNSFPLLFSLLSSSRRPNDDRARSCDHRRWLFYWRLYVIFLVFT